MSGRPFSQAADTQRNLGKPANGGATAAAPCKAMLLTELVTVSCATEEMLQHKCWSICVMFPAHPNKLMPCRGSQRWAPFPQRYPTWWFALLSTHRQNGGATEPGCKVWGMILTCPFLCYKNLQEAQHALLGILCVIASCAYPLPLHPFGQKVSFRIKGIERLTILHKRSSALAEGLRPVTLGLSI